MSRGASFLPHVTCAKDLSPFTLQVSLISNCNLPFWHYLLPLNEPCAPASLEYLYLQYLAAVELLWGFCRRKSWGFLILLSRAQSLKASLSFPVLPTLPVLCAGDDVCRPRSRRPVNLPIPQRSASAWEQVCKTRSHPLIIKGPSVMLWERNYKCQLQIIMGNYK